MGFRKFISEFTYLILWFAVSLPICLIVPMNKPFSGNYFHTITLSEKQPDLNFNRDNPEKYSVKLSGGNYYKYATNGYYSSFYFPNLININTSVYWHHSVLVEKSEFYLNEVKNKTVQSVFLSYKPDLPIISLLFNPDDFFDYSEGIYVQGKSKDVIPASKIYPEPWNKPANFYLRGNRSNRKVFFSVYDEKGKHKFSAYSFAKISGNATRSFPQKSLCLTSSKLFSGKKFKYDFFNDNNNYESLVLRNGGNDNTLALVRNSFMQSDMEALGLLASTPKPYLVYFNGLFWGIHFIQNKFDRNFVAEQLDVKEKKVTLVENWQLKKGDKTVFNNLIHDLNILKKKFDYEFFNEVFNTKNLSLYLAAEIYYANTDWPNNNIKMYKVNEGKSFSKWEFAFFDLDYGSGYTGIQAVNTNMFDRLINGKDNFSLLVKNLLNIPEFKLQLKEDLNKIIKNQVNSTFESYYNKIKNSIRMHTERWRKPLNEEEWEKNISVIRQFQIDRPLVIKNQIKKYLD